MTVATIVLPVFALIGIGYLAARFRLLSDAAQRGLTEFSAALAIPALLFRTVATSAAPTVSPLRLWAAYFGAAAITWALAALLTRFVLRRPVIDAASIAMTSTYGNTVMLGIPLCLTLYGEAAAAPIAMILAIHSPVFWIVATLHHETVTAEARVGAASLLLGVARDLARNPLIVAIVLGGLWRMTGAGMPAILDKILSLLAQAGVPSALVALGTTLVGFAIAGQGPTLTTVIVLKLVAMPLAAAGLAWFLDLPPMVAGVVVLFAAMPAGANAYLFAAKVQRAINSASGAVALGTSLSLLTASAIVLWLSG